MKIGVPKEIREGEERVALTPETVGRLVKSHHEVLIESGAGRDYNLDEIYEEAGAKIVSSPEEIYGESDTIIKVAPPTEGEVGHMREGQILVCFINGPNRPRLVKRLADAGVTVFSNELIPRTGTAQSMDVLSSMGSISGYKCAIIGADYLGKYVPTLTTAAGTTQAAKVIVLGAAVAGLQAIATMSRLGARVFAYDIMPVVKDQVHSLGATFIDSADQEEDEEEVEEEGYEPTPFRRLMVFFGFYSFAKPPEPVEDAGEREDEEEEQPQGPFSEEKQEEDYKLIREHLKDTDIVITTALIPGAPAPTLITQDMVEDMQPGSVIVDLAAENGGNCELTEPGRIAEHAKVRIIGPVNLPSSMPIHASQLYSRNMKSLIDHLVEDRSDEDSDEKDLRVGLDFEDEIIDAMCIAHNGKIRHDKTREALENASQARKAQ
ncbi:MAG: NAD(P) transhydrogenase subunit alpha [Rubrobacteraceae bacterium]